MPADIASYLFSLMMLCRGSISHKLRQEPWRILMLHLKTGTKPFLLGPRPVQPLQLSALDVGTFLVCHTDRCRMMCLPQVVSLTCRRSKMFVSNIKLHPFWLHTPFWAPWRESIVYSLREGTSGLTYGRPLGYGARRTGGGLSWGLLVKSSQHRKETVMKSSEAQGDRGTSLTSQHDRCFTCWCGGCFATIHHRAETGPTLWHHMVRLESTKLLPL